MREQRSGGSKPPGKSRGTSPAARSSTWWWTNKTLERNGVGLRRFSVSVISPTARWTSPGEDISDPLLADTLAKFARGRAETDSGEILQDVSLTCLHRPGLLPGQLVEVHDATMGQTWRGKVTGVTHTAAGPKLTTTLEIVRHAPATRRSTIKIPGAVTVRVANEDVGEHRRYLQARGAGYRQ
ncbi:MAG: hypothetical protein HQL66_11705 [Magnetococcales bacterium]|nr:hypothetical protein [Magnetococcales bacterium]